MNKYGDTVLRVAASVTGNLSDAEDVFSDVFFLFWQLDKKFSSDEHLKAWLIRVAVNKAKNIRKSARNRLTAQLHENIFDDYPEPDFDVQTALEKLKPRERAIIYLHYYEGYSYNAIARIIGLREVSVRSVAMRAREYMKEILKLMHE